jgi:hypothetical protein
MRIPGLLFAVPLFAAGGCTCGSRSTPEPPASSSSGAASTTPPPSASAGSASRDGAVFSAPIAAARVGHVDVVAGLVATEGVIRAMGMVDGKAAWVADVLRGVSWSPDVEVHMRPAGDGVALVWRGPRQGKTTRQLVLFGPHGEARGEPVEIASGFCATADGMAWIDPHTSGRTRVLTRGWTAATAHEVTTLSPERDPALVCAEHAIFVLGDGDDDLTVTSFAPGDAAAEAPRVAAREADFRSDEEREHDVYAVGDDLVFVRVGSSGALQLRDLPRAGAPGPWRKMKQTISPDDDVVAVDGDADSTLVVFTHDADEACPGIGSTAESVRALRVDRKTGAEAVLELAAPDCDHSRGPFWVGRSGGGPSVAWVERALKLPPTGPPVSGVAVRAITTGGVKPHRIDLQADAIADAGCDDHGCAVAALVRAPGDDDMRPEAIAVFPYP